MALGYKHPPFYCDSFIVMFQPKSLHLVRSLEFCRIIGLSPDGAQLNRHGGLLIVFYLISMTINDRRPFQHYNKHLNDWFPDHAAEKAHCLVGHMKTAKHEDKRI